MTILLLNYKRPENIPIILESIRSQTEKAKVFLWNNGTYDFEPSLFEHYEKASKNMGCMVRWQMATAAETPYVMSIDDDLCFASKDALKIIVDEIEAQKESNCILGAYGRNFISFYSYEIGKNIFPSKKKGDQAVDLIKGRNMVFRKKLLDSVILENTREDDIFLNSIFANKRKRFHLVPQNFEGLFKELPTHGVGNDKESKHYKSRQDALIKYNLGEHKYVVRHLLIPIEILYKVISRALLKIKVKLKKS